MASTPLILFYVGGIFFCFLLQGIIQEQLYQFRDPDTNGKFKFPITLVSCVCTLSATVGYFMCKRTYTPLVIESNTPSTAASPTSLRSSGIDAVDNHETFVEPHSSSGGAADDVAIDIPSGKKSSVGGYEKESAGSSITTVESTPGIVLDALRCLMDGNIRNNSTYSTLLKQGWLMSITYIGSMICTNVAMTQVPYPVQVIVKSAKSVPVVLGGYFFFGKRYPMSDYVTVGMVTAALMLFQSVDIIRKWGKGGASASLLGFAALMTSLVCDAMTGPRQDSVISTFNLQSNDVMLLINVGAVCIGWPLAIMLETPTIIRIAQVSVTDWAYGMRICCCIALFVCCGSAGQIFIVRVLKELGSLHLTLITTTRKFIAIILSIVIFGHSIHALQWLAIAILFGSGFTKYTLSKKEKAQIKLDQMSRLEKSKSMSVKA